MEKYMIIDGERVSFTDEKNILAVIRKAGIILPTFCYYSDLSIYGACRMCVVEDKWEALWHPVLHRQSMRWRSIRIHHSFITTENVS